MIVGGILIQMEATFFFFFGKRAYSSLEKEKSEENL